MSFIERNFLLAHLLHAEIRMMHISRRSTPGQRHKSRRSLLACLFGSTLVVATSPLFGQEPAPRVVKFQTSDSMEIVGDYFDAPKSSQPAPAALLIHMFRTDRSTWKPLIAPLRAAGFAVLAIDLRGHGDSARAHLDELKPRLERQDPGVFRDMLRDVEAAHGWLLSQEGVDKARFVVVGASVGASLAIDYAARDRSVDGVVMLTPGTGYMGLDSVTPAMRYGARPVLLVSVEDDRRAVDLLAKMNPGATSHVEGRGTGHGTRIFEVVPGMTGRVVEFLTQSVGPRSKNKDEVVSVLDGDEYFRDAAQLKKRRKDTKDAEIRWYSSAAEAEARGLKRAK